MSDAPSNADLERLREGVRYCQIGRYEVGDVVYGVEVWEHKNNDAPALFGIETTSEERAWNAFHDTPIDDAPYDVFLFRASVSAVGDDVPDDLTVVDWSSTEEPVLLSDVEILNRRPPSDPPDDVQANLERIVAHYETRAITLGSAARLARVTRWDMRDLLLDPDVDLRLGLVDEADAEYEVEAAKDLLISNSDASESTETRDGETDE